MDRHERLGVWLLAIGQTLGFATLPFAFGAILLALEAGTAWSRAELGPGPSLGLGVEVPGFGNFGAISGTLAIAPLGASAIAPVFGAVLIGAGA